MYMFKVFPSNRQNLKKKSDLHKIISALPKTAVSNRCVSRGGAKGFRKKYLGTSNFAVFVREIWREEKSVSSGGKLFFRYHHDFETKIEKSLRNF